MIVQFKSSRLLDKKFTLEKKIHTDREIMAFCLIILSIHIFVYQPGEEEVNNLVIKTFLG